MKNQEDRKYYDVQRNVCVDSLRYVFSTHWRDIVSVHMFFMSLSV